MYNICDTFTLSFFSADATMWSVCVALKAHITVTYIKILNVAQQHFYG